MRKQYSTFCIFLCCLSALPASAQFTKSFTTGNAGKVSFSGALQLRRAVIDTMAVVQDLKNSQAVNDFVKQKSLGDGGAPDLEHASPDDARAIFNLMDTAQDLTENVRRVFEQSKEHYYTEVPVTLSYHDIRNYIDTSANVSDALKQVIRDENRYKAYYDAVGITTEPGALIAWAWAEKCDSIKDALIAQRKAVAEAAIHGSNPDSLNNLADTLSDKIILYGEAYEFYQALNVLNGTPRLKRRFFPLRSVAQAQYFYFDKQSDKSAVNLLSNFALQTDADSKYAVSADIISGVFPLFRKVPLKLEISTTIAQDKDSTTESKTAGKVLYGGLIHAGLTYPLFFSNWNYWNGKSVNIYMPLSATINFDNVNEGSQLLKDVFYFGDVSASLYMKWDLVQSQDNADLASIFLNGRFSFIAGGSSFYDNLPGERKGFCTFQFNAGLKIWNRYSLAVNFPVWSSNKDLLNRQNATIALIIDPNFSSK